VLAHTEASQSGIAAIAHGLGVPVIATPVGGLPEQVRDGITGLVATRADAQNLAAAIRALARDPELYRRIVAGIAETRQERSMQRFLSGLVDCACGRRE
jgi:glycosyltransferase involved in cell wall biosynthesis